MGNFRDKFKYLHLLFILGTHLDRVKKTLSKCKIIHIETSLFAPYLNQQILYLRNLSKTLHCDRSNQII